MVMPRNFNWLAAFTSFPSTLIAHPASSAAHWERNLAVGSSRQPPASLTGGPSAPARQARDATHAAVAARRLASVSIHDIEILERKHMSIIEVIEIGKR